MLRLALLAFGRWIANCCELTITEMLSDSIVQAVMKSDGVDPKTLENELRRMALRADASGR